MDFFFPPSPFFVVTDISPHFPGIKNPFWIIHSVLNLAATCIHNKLNLLRRFWDLWWMCRWQTTRILSFIFNTKPSRSSHIHSCGRCFLFSLIKVQIWLWILKMQFMSYQLWNKDSFLCIYPKDTVIQLKTEKRETTPQKSHQNRERSTTHFLMVTQAMRPGNWTVGGSLCVLPPDMPQIPLKDSFL